MPHFPPTNQHGPLSGMQTGIEREPSRPWKPWLVGFHFCQSNAVGITFTMNESNLNNHLSTGNQPPTVMQTGLWTDWIHKRCPAAVGGSLFEQRTEGRCSTPGSPQQVRSKSTVWDGTPRIGVTGRRDGHALPHQDPTPAPFHMSLCNGNYNGKSSWSPSSNILTHGQLGGSLSTEAMHTSTNN